MKMPKFLAALTADLLPSTAGAYVFLPVRLQLIWIIFSIVMDDDDEYNLPLSWTCLCFFVLLLPLIGHGSYVSADSVCSSTVLYCKVCNTASRSGQHY